MPRSCTSAGWSPGAWSRRRPKPRWRAWPPRSSPSSCTASRPAHPLPRSLPTRRDVSAMHTLRLLWFVPSPVAVVADALRLASTVTVQAARNPSSEAQFDALACGEVDAVVTAMDNVMDWNLRPGPRDLRIVAQVEGTTPLTL